MYGPTTIVAAKAIKSSKCRSMKMMENQRTKMAWCNAEHHNYMEAVIREVYKFTGTKVKKCGFYNQSTTDLDKENDESGWGHKWHHTQAMAAVVAADVSSCKSNLGLDSKD